jgi:predicted acylesterase/phospholipase RssA
VGKRTVSLVLGSGGARGLAHIGIIRWLEANDYRVCSIAGSSMGALISKSLDTVQNTIARFQLAAYSPDVTIDISRDACSFYEFHRAEEMIQLGWSRAEAVLGSGWAK